MIFITSLRDEKLSVISDTFFPIIWKQDYHNIILKTNNWKNIEFLRIAAIHKEYYFHLKHIVPTLMLAAVLVLRTKYDIFVMLYYTHYICETYDKSVFGIPLNLNGLYIVLILDSIRKRIKWRRVCRKFQLETDIFSIIILHAMYV